MKRGGGAIDGAPGNQRHRFGALDAKTLISTSEALGRFHALSERSQSQRRRLPYMTTFLRWNIRLRARNSAKPLKQQGYLRGLSPSPRHIDKKKKKKKNYKEKYIAFLEMR